MQEPRTSPEQVEPDTDGPEEPVRRPRSLAWDTSAAYRSRPVEREPDGSVERSDEHATYEHADRGWPPYAWDEEGLEAPDNLAPRRSLWTALRAWLVLALVLVGLVAGLRYFGDGLYNPASRVPEVASFGERGLFGATAPVLAELEDMAEIAQDLGASELSVSGEVYRIDLPRTFGDQLFDKRHERATIVYVSGGGREQRFLLLQDPETGRSVFAMDTSPRRPNDDFIGTYLALPSPDDPSFAPFTGLAESLEALVPSIEAAPTVTRTSGSYTLFGPYNGARVDELRARVAGNYVLAHQAGELMRSNADVTIVAPVFFVQPAPERGVIRGIYASRWRTISEPLWGDGDTSVLAHELTHAYVDRVLPNANTRMQQAAEYFERAHPRLYGVVVDDLYSQLNDAGRAEETLAFLMGAIAEEDTETVPPSTIFGNQGAASTSEAVLRSDIEMLIELGLLPDCMDPEALRHTAIEITFAYYAAARAACTSTGG